MLRALALSSMVFFPMAAVGHAPPTPAAPAPLPRTIPDYGVMPPPEALPVEAVRITGGFWAQRQATNAARTAWANFEQCEKTGRIENFRNAAKVLKGEKAEFRGLVYDDSDVYKAIEGACYVIAAGRAADGSEDANLGKLRARVNELVELIGEAQHPDGYINTYFTIKEPDKRWAGERWNHELYCAGHLIEAAIAHEHAIGGGALLNAATRFADYIDATFGPEPGKRIDVPGHEETELALFKLARQTGEDKYARLADFFIAQRGQHAKRESYEDYAQDHKPVRDQREVVGHAVRAMYLFSAVADSVRLSNDAAYTRAMLSVWDDLTNRKTYVTGGIGPSASNEGFTTPYDLPNDTAYAETCAGIGSVLFNWRLANLYRDGRFADAMERALYNGVLSGVSLAGDGFFYVNPLRSDGGAHRQPWFGTACCPPNVLRTIAQVGSMTYSRDSRAVYVHLFNESVAYLSGQGPMVLPRPADPSVRVPPAEELFGPTLTQTTNYPWDGKVTFRIDGISGASRTPSTGFDLMVRIPGWCRGAAASVNGSPIELKVERGYANLGSTWKNGDTVELNLPMPIERVESSPRVKSNAGYVVLQRGPVVYCLEAVDNGPGVLSMVLPPDSVLQADFKPDLLGGVSVITGEAIDAGPPRPWKGRLYAARSAMTRRAFTAVPYFAWDNRTPGEMTVWLPESPTLVDSVEAPPAALTASHCWRNDSLAAMMDGREPSSSSDESVPRMTFWPQRGSTEWVQAAFDGPREIESCDVYWFDDSNRRGGCRLPKACRVMVKDDAGNWKPVAAIAPGALKANEFNTVHFDPVTTTDIKLEIDLQPGFSAGVLEWRVNER